MHIIKHRWLRFPIQPSATDFMQYGMVLLPIAVETNETYRAYRYYLYNIGHTLRTCKQKYGEEPLLL